MNDSIELFRRLGTARPGDPAPDTRVETVPLVSDEEEATAAFGYLRGIRERALNVEFRRAAEGDEVSFPYGWLGPTRHHPSVGIQLLFAGSELYLVTLRGRNLNAPVSDVSLYERGLLRQRVTWCREATREESRTLPESACVIERIEIRVVSAAEANRVFSLAGTSEAVSSDRAQTTGASSARSLPNPTDRLQSLTLADLIAEV